MSTTTQNYFLQLPPYERIELLNRVSDDDVLNTLLAMEEFAFLRANDKLRERFYKERLEKYFSHLLPLREAGLSWEELYNRFSNMNRDIKSMKNPFSDVFELAKKYLESEKLMEFFILYTLYPNAKKNYELANIALFHNLVSVLEFLKGHYILPSLAIVFEAVQYGNLDALKWLYENAKIQFDSDLADIAAEHGQLETLKWLHSIGVYPSKYGLAHAASLNQLGVLKWAVSKFNMTPFDNISLINRMANTEMYNFLLSHGLIKRRINVIERYDFENMNQDDDNDNYFNLDDYQEEDFEE